MRRKYTEVQMCSLRQEKQNKFEYTKIDSEIDTKWKLFAKKITIENENSNEKTSWK